MYLRPLLLGTGPTLGLRSAPEFTFVIYSAAVGSYFPLGGLKPIALKVEERYHRAAPRGVGDAKCAGALSFCLGIHGGERGVNVQQSGYTCRKTCLTWDGRRAGNYGGGLAALYAAKEAGFTDVVYLDARTDTNLEELSAANIFVVKVCHCSQTKPCVCPCAELLQLCCCAALMAFVPGGGVHGNPTPGNVHYGGGGGQGS